MPSARPPIRYTAAMEQPAENEAEVIAELDRVLGEISRKTFEDSGQALRSVHAKAHGLLRAELRVHEGLPQELAQGLFAMAGTYPATLRFSTIPGDMLPDSVSTPRGVGIKIGGVAGARVAGSEGAATQDFVLVNAPAFSAPDAETFLGNLKLLAATTDRATGLKSLASRIARGTEAVLEAFGAKSALVSTLGGQPATHILGETFYSQVPILYGDYMAKVSLAPSSFSLRALAGAPVDLNAHPDALRDAVRSHFAVAAAEWELRIQLCTDLASMPIEDASVAWPEAASPYRTVATLSAPAQDSWSDEAVGAVDRGMAFSPWHGLAAHRPLGSVNRSRRATYEHSAAARANRSGCPICEPG